MAAVEEVATHLASDDTLFQLERQLEDFFAAPEFTTAIGTFGSEHAQEFTQLMSSDATQLEHPLRWHELYKEYTEMIEAKLQAFLNEHSVPLNSLLDLVRGSNSRELACIDYLFASTEYTAFLQLMQDFLSMQDWACDDMAVPEGELESASLANSEDGAHGVPR